MNNNIKHILEKYWNAETNLQEEAELISYFASADVKDNHKEFVGLFDFISNQRNLTTDLDVSELLNNINGIDALINKYQNAETTIKEEKILKVYFSSDAVSPEHLEFKSLFGFYSIAGSMTTDIEFDVKSINDNSDIDSLLTKYLNAETTLDEEKELNTYFQSDNVEEKHMEFKSLFAFYDQAANMTTDIDIASVIGQSTNEIDDLLKKFWNAETSIKEEETLHSYFASEEVADKDLATKDLFIYYANQRSAKSNLDLEQLFKEEKSNAGSAASDNAARPQANEAKVFSLRKLASAIAAIFVLGFAAVTIMNQSAEPETQYRGKYVQLDTEAEAQEAYEITKQAFALLSKKMNNGSKTVKKSMKKAENASIFK